MANVATNSMIDLCRYAKALTHAFTGCERVAQAIHEWLAEPEARVCSCSPVSPIAARWPSLDMSATVRPAPPSRRPNCHEWRPNS